jgi:nucleoside 2-deoxyribosyltransferase
MTAAAPKPPCPLCDSPGTDTNRAGNRDAYWIRCRVCGRFLITPEGLGSLEALTIKPKRYLISALARRASEKKQPLELLSYTISELVENARAPSTPFEVLDSLLLDIHVRTSTLTGFVNISYDDYVLFTLRSRAELSEFIDKLRSLGYIEASIVADGITCRLTLKGWERIPELQHLAKATNQAFVAMSFAAELDNTWIEGFKPALAKAGWDPMRIDRVEHNGKIDDRIVAEIRKSGLVVADFTGNRGGVYFEAGLAVGLGIPVVWTVRETDINEVHFDTRQYNHVVWKDAVDLATKLYNRLAGTISIPLH